MALYLQCEGSPPLAVCQDIGRPAHLGVVGGGHLAEGSDDGLSLDPGAVSWLGAAALVETEGRGGHKPRKGPGALVGVGGVGHDDEVLKHQQL